MTEITEIKGTLLMPHPRPVTHRIDPVAFFVALIGGPLLATLATFWVALIPVFALLFGGPPYLVLGTPVLLWYLSTHEASPARIAVLALMTFVPATLLLTAVALLFGVPNDFDFVIFYGGFGLIFAPLWGASFGWLYLRLRSDFYTQKSTLTIKGDIPC